MKNTRDLLMVLFWTQLIVPAALYVCCEFLNLDISILAGSSDQLLYILSTVMILATLALIPTALRLLKMKRIHDDLILRREDALSKWGRVRLLILGDLLAVNTVLYYAFGFEPTFGYLAVITLLTMPFVYPTLQRCYAEVEDDSTAEATPEDHLEESV